MAVVQPLRPLSTATPGDAGTATVVRIVEFLGPISPELVLVDPELAPRARAVLPELAWNWTPHTRELGAPIPLRVLAVPAETTSRWRLPPMPALALGGSVVVALVLGISMAARDSRDFPAVKSLPPLAGPATKPRGSSAPPAPPKKTKKPASSQPVRVPPRFVWPVEKGATGYRVALYKADRQIFEQDVKTTALQLSQSWTYEGRFYGLTKGTYRWVVWALSRDGTVRPGPAVVSASYTA